MRKLQLSRISKSVWTRIVALPRIWSLNIRFNTTRAMSRANEHVHRRAMNSNCVSVVIVGYIRVSDVVSSLNEHVAVDIHSRSASYVLREKCTQSNAN